MAWLRLSDTLAMHPTVLAAMEHPDADERSVDEVFGFMVRCALMSAQDQGNYLVTYPTAMQLAGAKARADGLLAQAEFSGFGVREVDEETGRIRFRFVEDSKFIHMRSAEEIDFENQRKADNGDFNITVPVRHRDGDACRYCYRVVNWSDRRSERGGTYDHRPPGRPGSAETSVVACLHCNSSRGALSRGLGPEAGLAAADAVHPLRPAPKEPYYKAYTRKWFQEHATVLAQYGLKPPPLKAPSRPLKAGSLAPGAAEALKAMTDEQRASSADNATGGVRPASADTAPTDVRPAAPQPAPSKPAPGRRKQRPNTPADRKGTGSNRAGSGRDGTGVVGKGRDGPGAARPPGGSGQPPGRRRRRRGSRGSGRNRPGGKQ